MFTSEQIKKAHEKVKSGSDFPAYIKEIKSFGVIMYETYVEDGHTDFYGDEDYTTSLPAKYESLTIEDEPDTRQFIADLRSHQKGNTDYFTFCKDCAKSGVKKWVVKTDKMTCTYYDNEGNKLLVENIPG